MEIAEKFRGSKPVAETGSFYIWSNEVVKKDWMRSWKSIRGIEGHGDYVHTIVPRYASIRPASFSLPENVFQLGLHTSHRLPSNSARSWLIFFSLLLASGLKLSALCVVRCMQSTTAIKGMCNYIADAKESTLLITFIKWSEEFIYRQLRSDWCSHV